MRGAVVLLGVLAGCAGFDEGGLAPVEPAAAESAVAVVPEARASEAEAAVVDEAPQDVALEPVAEGACAEEQPTGRGTSRRGVAVQIDAREDGTVSARLVGTRSLARPFRARLYASLEIYRQAADGCWVVPPLPVLKCGLSKVEPRELRRGVSSVVKEESLGDGLDLPPGRYRVVATVELVPEEASEGVMVRSAPIDVELPEVVRIAVVSRGSELGATITNPGDEPIVIDGQLRFSGPQQFAVGEVSLPKPLVVAPDASITLYAPFERSVVAPERIQATLVSADGATRYRSPWFAAAGERAE